MMTLKELKEAVEDAYANGCADDMPVVFAHKKTYEAQMPEIDDFYEHTKIDAFYRLVPSEFLEDGMPEHEDGALELIADGLA